MPAQTYFGSCLCQAVSYQVDGSFEGFFLCHCSHCRRETGSAHGAKLFSSEGLVTWKSGEDKVKVFTLKGTRYSRAFCETCGGALPVLQKDIGWVIPAGSLKSDSPLQPTAHIHHASRANWDNHLERIPSFAGLPS